jgi:hypothetical protein
MWKLIVRKMISPRPNFTLFSDLQQLNAPRRISFTPSGRKISMRLEQLLNAHRPKFTTPLPSFTMVSEVHWSKAKFAISFVASGRQIPTSPQCCECSGRG